MLAAKQDKAQQELPKSICQPWHVVVVFIRWDWLSRAGSTKTNHSCELPIRRLVPLNRSVGSAGLLCTRTLGTKSEARKGPRLRKTSLDFLDDGSATRID